MIAGASEGIGAAFATYLAQLGFDLVLIARNEEKLIQFSHSLKSTYHILVTPIICDLSNLDAVEEMKKSISEIEINILIYNAALSFIGKFEEQPIEEYNRMMITNINTPVSLIHYFGQKMKSKKRGAIILMSSLAGEQGSGFLSMYGATKSFNRILAEGLWYEWKEEGVAVLACVAGATATPNFINTHPKKISFHAPKVQTPEEVVQECFRHLGKNPFFISGFGNKIAHFIMSRLLPRKLAIKIMGDTTRKMYLDQ